MLSILFPLVIGTTWLESYLECRQDEQMFPLLPNVNKRRAKLFEKYYILQPYSIYAKKKGNYIFLEQTFSIFISVRSDL